ncbi:MAG: hypothetical protein PHQ65_07820 [Bacteroidales bacterium]|nr:hypothetical protein [Bacteroidales bacterium]MDD3665157.1 hypothetical protein [Bacteroidales bacterium]
MKTIYLRCVNLDCLIKDIQRALPGYNGETEYQYEDVILHLIGDIPTSFDEEGSVTTWAGAFHANIYAPESFDESVFQTRMDESPAKPVNRLAL